MFWEREVLLGRGGSFIQRTQGVKQRPPPKMGYPNVSIHHSTASRRLTSQAWETRH